MRETTTIAVAAAAAFFVLGELSRMGVFDPIAVQVASLFRTTSATPTAQARAEKCEAKPAPMIAAARRSCDVEPHTALIASDGGL